MINIMIVDDEPLAIALLEDHISKIDGLKLLATAKNAMEAYQVLQHQTIDLMFLDIQMPDLNGIDFLKSLYKKPKTVLTTAYREYAIDGFELEAVDYLLKPITFNRFFKAVDRVLRHNNKKIDEDFIILKAEGFNRKIILGDIIYMESNGNDIKVMLCKELIAVPKMTINELSTRLRHKGFLRIHRSFLINTSWINAVNNDAILLSGFKIPVGRSYKKEFDDVLKKFYAKRLF